MLLKEPSTSSNFQPFLLSFFSSLMIALHFLSLSALTLCFCFSNLYFAFQLLPFFISFFFNLVSAFSLTLLLTLSVAIFHFPQLFLSLLFDFFLLLF